MENEINEEQAPVVDEKAPRTWNKKRKIRKDIIKYDDDNQRLELLKKRFLNVKEAAHLIGVGYHTLFMAVKDGRVATETPAYSKRKLIPIAEVKRIMRGGEV